MDQSLSQIFRGRDLKEVEQKASDGCRVAVPSVITEPEEENCPFSEGDTGSELQQDHTTE